MKKVLIVLLVIIALFIGALIALPLIFKDKLVAIAKEAANEQLDATVDFGDFDLSLLRSFPNLNFQIEDVTVDNHGTFEGVRLAEIGALEFTIHLMPLLNGDVVIKELGIRNSSFDVRVNADEAANYDIMKASDEEEVEAETADTSATEFNIELQRYYLENINLVYDDVPLTTKVTVSNLNHEGSGDFTQDLFTLHTETSIESMDVVYDGIAYLHRAHLEADADFEIDMNNSKYTLKDNQFELNELVLGIDGWVAMPEDPIDMDLTFYAKEGQFRHFLSLVPAEFASDLEGVDVTGTLAFNGHARGTYTEEEYPGFGLELIVDDARFQYPDLPASAENIAINCKIDHPGGDLDRMTVEVSQFHVEMAGNPIDANLTLKTPMSDPDLNASIKANMDFANVGRVVPMEEELSGSLEADVELRGRYSAIEEERYEDFHAAGFLNLLDFRYNSEDYDVLISEANMNFTPQYAELSRLNVEMEGLDMAAQGRLENYLAYALKDSLLVGQLNLQSNRIDLNAFMDSEGESAEETETEETSQESYEVLEVPANIRFDLNAQIDELIYDNIVISNMNGNIRVADQQLTMNNVNMKVLEGDVVMNGTYDSRNLAKPEVDFAFDARELDIRETATTFVTVEKLMPLAKNATGKFSTKMTFQSELDSAMNPVLESIYGKGSFASKNVYIEGFEPLNELARVLKIDRLAEQNIEDVNFNFEIVEGRAYVEPFDVKIDQINTTVSGSTGLDQTIDYTLEMEVPTKILKGGAMDMVQGLMGQAAGLLGQEFSMGETIEVDVLVGGTVEKPTFRPSFGGMGGGKSAGETAKEVIKEEIDKAKDEAVDRAVDEAREQAAKLVSEAEKQGDRLRTEAKKQADRVRQEGRNAAKKLEDEANNPITKAAARKAGEKLIEEADKNADKIEAEADKQARNLVEEAEKQGDKLINEAEAKVR